MRYAWFVCCLCILNYVYLTTMDSCCTQVAAFSVNLYPRLLIVPVNTSVLLTCEVQYNGFYSVQWYRNLETLPFHTNPHVVNSSTLNHTIIVGSEDKNTSIQCFVHDVTQPNITKGSNNITLNAVSEAGVTPNPQVEPILDDDSRDFHLKWSPPFLWRAFPIHYCIVSIIHTNRTDSVRSGNNIKIIAGSTATYNESGIMSLNRSIDNLQSQTCTEITFLIMAFTLNNEFHNRSVSVTGRYPSDLGNFSESAISTVTLVTSDTSSKNNIIIVRIQIELPPLCSYQEMSYNLSVDNANGSTIFFQTYTHTGSGIVNHDINQTNTDGLELNKNYSLKVVARASFADSEPVKTFHEFYTKFNKAQHINNAYKAQHKDLLLVLQLIVYIIFFK